MFGLIRADLARHWVGALAVALLVALATALGVTVTLEERALRLGSARAAAAFDLVVGAPGSETQLVLSAVFLQPAPLPLLPGRVLATLAADPRVASAAPVGFGDVVDTYPLLGTTPNLIEGLGGLAEGRGFARLSDAVAGAGVSLPVGASFHPMHGDVHGSATAHGEATYVISGRLKPTGTPWDRAILVPIEAVWRIHGHEDHGHEDHAQDVHDGDAHAEDTHAEDAQEHEADAQEADAHEDGGHEDAGHASDATRAGEGEAPAGAPARPLPDGASPAHALLDAPVDPHAVMRPDAPGVPAILVKPRTIADAYKLRQDYRGNGTQAVFPAEVLTRLYGTLGDARSVLVAVAAGAQALVAAAILLVVFAHVSQRRVEIAALRAFGAPRTAIFCVVFLQLALVVGAGLVAGYAFGYGAARLLAAEISRQSGFALPVAFAPEDVLTFALMLAAGAIAAVIPAALACRQPPAAALRGA